MFTGRAVGKGYKLAFDWEQEALSKRNYRTVRLSAHSTSRSEREQMNESIIGKHKKGSD